MPGGDPNGPKRTSNPYTDWIETAIHNVDLALDDPETPESAKPSLYFARGNLLEALEK